MKNKNIFEQILQHIMTAADKDVAELSVSIQAN
jgi:hypothetical protein